MKVHQYFGQGFQRVSLLRHPMVLGTQCVGVEVELENIQEWDMNSEYWVVKEDGSLRNNGREFVFRGPTGGKDLYNALCELDDFLSTRNPDGNWRCSTHVHLDVRDMNVEQLKKLVLAYVVAEKALFRLAAMHRYTNNFCAAIGFAQDQLQILANAWPSADIGIFWRKLEGWNKYSALNLLPMHNFGSVEFRMSDAKWKKNDLLLLCNRFLALKELAMHWEGTEEEMVGFMLSAPIHEVFPKGIPVDMAPDALVEDLSVGHKLAFDLLTFQAVAAEELRVPVEMPEIRGGDGQWNNLDNQAHTDIVTFMIRAGIPGDLINKMIYDLEDGELFDEQPTAPALKVGSHVVCRHYWGLWMGLRGNRVPNGDMPRLFPAGVIRELLRHQLHQVNGLLPMGIMDHLLTQEQRDMLNVPPQAAPRPMRAAGRARGAVNGAQFAPPGEGVAQWFVEDPHAVRMVDPAERVGIVADEDDEFEAGPDEDGPF